MGCAGAMDHVEGMNPQLLSEVFQFSFHAFPTLVPKLCLGNASLEAPLPVQSSRSRASIRAFPSGAWERVLSTTPPFSVHLHPGDAESPRMRTSPAPS